MPPVAEKDKERKREEIKLQWKQEQNKGSRLLLLRADRLTARSEHVLLERSFVEKGKEKKSRHPWSCLPCCPALLLLVLIRTHARL